MRGRVNFGGGARIKGLIKEYIADCDNISAGEFVKFVKVAQANASNFKESSRNYPKADIRQLTVITMSPNKVLILNNQGSLIFGTVCIFEENNVTIYPLNENLGLWSTTTTDLLTNTTFSAEAINENKLLLFYNNNDQGSICAVIDITDNQVNILKKVVLNYKFVYCGSSIKKINDNKFLLTYTNTYIYQGLLALICTIENNDISIVQENNLNIFGAYNNTISLSENKFLSIGTTRKDVYSSIGNSGKIGVSLYEVGANIKVLNTKTLVVSANDVKPSLLKINDDIILIVYKDSTDNLLYGVICSISDNNISFGTKTKLSDKSTYDFSMIKNQKDEILIIFNNLNCLKCIVEDLEITVKSDEEMTSTNYNVDLVFSTTDVSGEIFTIFTSKSSPYYPIYSFTFDAEARVSHQIEPNDTILGVSKTKANKGDKIKVIIPERSDNNG